ncbi:hypothetical protein QQG74_13435 [Micromonospora sp. FIMYZ51]
MRRAVQRAFDFPSARLGRLTGAERHQLADLLAKMLAATPGGNTDR